MKTYTQRLAEKRKESADFTRTNFGLQLGSDFPSVATELLSSDEFAMDAIMNSMKAVMFIDNLKNSFETRKFKEDGINVNTLKEVIKENDHIHDTVLRYFYWGLQIGRDLEQEQAAVMSEMEKGFHS